MRHWHSLLDGKCKYLPLDLFFGLSWSVDVAVAAKLPWELAILGTVSLTTLLYYHLHLPSSLQTGITINYHLPPRPDSQHNNKPVSYSIFLLRFTHHKKKIEQEQLIIKEFPSALLSTFFWAYIHIGYHVISKKKTKYNRLGMSSWDGSVLSIE